MGTLNFLEVHLWKAHLLRLLVFPTFEYQCWACSCTWFGERPLKILTSFHFTRIYPSHVGSLSCHHPIILDHATLNNRTSGALLDLSGLAMLLLGNPLLLIVLSILEVGIPVSVETNAVPWKIEETIHALQCATRGLGHGEPHPDATDEGDGGEAPEGALGRDAAIVNGEQHVGDSAGVSVLETALALVVVGKKGG